MTPPTAPDAATDRRTVGDILHERGYISEEQLAQAVASQQQSGKPLGQVLVEAGAITRLELASALAEQWSDTATWLGPPQGSKGKDQRRLRPFPEDAFAIEGREAGYAQQLQDAVVELARRVASFEPALTDLRLRVETAEVGGPEKLLDRIEVVQDAVTALARRLDELTNGVERAFTAVEQGSAETAEELDALSGRIALAAERAALDEIRAAVEKIAARPGGDPVVAAQVDTLADRLEELRETIASRADAAAVEALRLAVESLTEQVGQSADTAALEELRASLAELAARPQTDADLALRVEELAARVDELADTGGIDAIRAVVDEIAGRPTPDPTLNTRIDDLVEQVAQRAEAAALDDLRSTVAELAARPQADADLAAQLEELTARIEALAGTDALEAVRAAVEEMAGRPAADPTLTARIEELAATLDETVTALGSRAEHSALTLLEDSVNELSERISSLADTQALDAVRATVEEVATRPAVAPELLDQLSELAARVEALATETTASDDEAVIALRARIDDLTAGAVIDPELERRVDNVVGRLDALHARVEEVASTLDSPKDETSVPTLDLAETLRAELESRIEEVAIRTDGLAQETAGAVGALASERSALEARIDSLAAELAEARLQAAPAPSLPAPEPSRPAKTKAKAVESAPAGVEGELERLRMAVERINLHLGERERAITDLMRSRNGEIKLEELAARLVELEQGLGGRTATSASETPAAGSADVHGDLQGLAQRLEEAEKSAKADRDKVMTQLERLASSIDWRFRRLESGETDAAA